MGRALLSKMVSTELNNTPTSSTLHTAASLAFSELVEERPEKKQEKRARVKRFAKKTLQDFHKKSLDDHRPPEVKAYAE